MKSSEFTVNSIYKLHLQELAFTPGGEVRNVRRFTRRKENAVRNGTSNKIFFRQTYGK